MTVNSKQVGPTSSASSLSVGPLVTDAPTTVLIVGAGIVGLVLALCLEKHVGIKAEVYERAPAFHKDVGAGMGMYANGLRVLRDIDPHLLDAVREQGEPLLVRRWERHDGSLILTAQEEVLSRGEEELQSIGIRRWKLQKVLYEAVKKKGIPVYFSKKAVGCKVTENGLVEIYFDDSSRRQAKFLFAADGAKSKIRELVTAHKTQPSPSLQYTGTTCLMGVTADCAKTGGGMSFTTSSTTKCHAVFFPTGEREQCFQFYFPMEEESPADLSHWGTLSPNIGASQCRLLAEKLRNDGWNEQYLCPLSNSTYAVKIELSQLKPPLTTWVHGKGKIVLIGDAAHPPQPYLGQGSQLGMEDAGTIALLLKAYKVNKNDGTICTTAFANAIRIYDQLRIPRATSVLGACINAGRAHQKRAEMPKYDIVQSEKMMRQIFYHETLPELLPGAQHNYSKVVEDLVAAGMPCVGESKIRVTTT